MPRRGPGAAYLARPVELAVEDEFVGGGLEAVDGGLGEARGWKLTRIDGQSSPARGGFHHVRYRRLLHRRWR
jgi:hypothetical protein